MKYDIVSLQNAPQMLESASEWFSEKWGIPKNVYVESMRDCISGTSPVPQWYMAVCEGEIVGGAGVIENDFHERRDLSPNVCAVFVEEKMRGQGIAGEILDRICCDMKSLGVDTLYLLTDHDSFYERYGWKFYCYARSFGEEKASRMYIKTT